MNKLMIIFFSILCDINVFASNQFNNFSTSIYLSSIIIQLISIYNIFSTENQPFSLNKIFYLSPLLFGINLFFSFMEVSHYLARLIKENEYFI